MGEMRQHYTTCMCPFCKTVFAVEVSFESIDVKTFSIEQQADDNIENKTEHSK